MDQALATQREHDEALVAQLVTQRQSWESSLRNIGDYIAPWLHEWDQVDAKGNASNQGQARDNQIINEAPCHALEVAASGLLNSLSDPTEKFMGLETEDPQANETYQVRRFLEDTTNEVLAELSRSGFFKVAPEVYKNVLAFGTAAQVTLESFDSDGVLSFQCFPSGSYYIGNDHRNRPAVFARKFTLTARQMVMEFGRENVCYKVQKAYDDKRTEQAFPLVHLVRPNDAWAPGRRDVKRYVSCYYEEGSKEKPYLRMRGFHTNPVQCPRWFTRGTNPYGFGPGHAAVRSAMALQAMEIDLALAREKQINPPLLAAPGVNPYAISTLPGAINQVQSIEGMTGLRSVYDVRFDDAKAREGIAEIERRIRETFYNNIFLMIANDEGGKMTAREVMERAREKRLALTPILRLTDEYLTPVIDRTMEILGQRGRLPPIPDELRGKRLRIQYKSVLAAAAQMEEASAIGQHMLNFTAPLLEVFPELADNYDADQLAREHARRSGVPNKVMRDPAEVEKMRAARAEMAQQQQQLDQGQQLADTAKTLAGADTQSKNALTDVLTGMRQ